MQALVIMSGSSRWISGVILIWSCYIDLGFGLNTFDLRYPLQDVLQLFRSLLLSSHIYHTKKSRGFQSGDLGGRSTPLIESKASILRPN